MIVSVGKDILVLHSYTCFCRYFWREFPSTGDNLDVEKLSVKSVREDVVVINEFYATTETFGKGVFSKMSGIH